MTREEGDRHEDWRHFAACVGKTELFFAEAHTANSVHMYDEAARLCASCPVLSECREYALTSSPEYGFLAGMSPRQRRLYRRGWRRYA